MPLRSLPINIEKHNGAFVGVMKEINKVMRIDGITQLKNYRAKLSKPSLRSLLKAIYCTTKPAYLFRWMRETRRRWHLE